MDTKLKEFYEELYESNFFDNKPYLSSLEMLSNKNITEKLLDPINRDTCVCIYNVHNDSDIILGTKYDVIFDRKNPKNYQKIDSEIDLVSLKKKIILVYYQEDMAE